MNSILVDPLMGCETDSTSRARESYGPSSSAVVFILGSNEPTDESLELAIRSQGCHLVPATSSEEFLSASLGLLPSCLILDMSDAGWGLAFQKRVAVERPHIPIIFINNEWDVETSVKAMKAGAVQFFTKSFQAEELLNAIREAHERSRFALAYEAEQRLLRKKYETLSHRERQVMALLVAGLLNKQVGAELGVCEKTVKVHRSQVMQKMKAGSFAELVKMGTRLGLTSRFEKPPLRWPHLFASIETDQRFRPGALVD